jgi:glucosamine-6-phosphate deaminase
MTGIDTRVAHDAEHLARDAAEVIAGTIAADPHAALVVATGETPQPTYRELARHVATGLDVSRIRVFQLDDYAGITHDDRRSLFAWMMRGFVEPLGVEPERVTRFDGAATDLDASCRRYEAEVAEAGGFDLAILGLGPNGHLGFNEPPSGRNAQTRPIELSAASVASNASYWGGEDQVPRRAVTAGMDLLLAARRIVLIVSGAHKRSILARALEGPIEPSVPASFLQEHRDVVVLTDLDARP